MKDGNYIVAVDIGTSYVTMDVARQNEDSTLHVLAEEKVEVGKGGMNAGRIDNALKVSEALKSARHNVEEELGIRISSAYAGIAGPHVRCVRYEDSVNVADVVSHCVTRDDLDRLKERISSVETDPSEEKIGTMALFYTIDGNAPVENPVGSYGKILRGTYMFVLADRDQTSRVRQVFGLTGISLSGIIANPTVGYRAVLTDDERTEGVMLLDMGGGTTDLTVVKDGHIEYFASIPIGGNVIDRDIHSGLGIPSSAISTVKHMNGSAIASKVDDKACFEFAGANNSHKKCLKWNLATVMECRLREILGLVREELKDSCMSASISHGIVLAGGNAYIEDLPELAGSIFGVETRLSSIESGFDEDSALSFSRTSASGPGLLVECAGRGFCAVTEIPAITDPDPVTVGDGGSNAATIATSTHEDDPHPDVGERSTRRIGILGRIRKGLSTLSNVLDGKEDEEL